MDHQLPFNRKERYFTGTVLPMLACGDNFAHFPRLLKTCGVPDDKCRVPERLQFYTEYSLREAADTSDTGKFVDRPEGKDAPDIVVLVQAPVRMLLVIEAKMYDVPSRAKLQVQLGRQSEVVDYLCRELDIDRSDAFHAALLPNKLKAQIGELSVPIVTWEQVLSEFADVGHPFFVDELRRALDRYEELRGKSKPRGSNAEAWLTGAELLERHAAGQRLWVGRNGGLTGKLLTKDLRSGKWRKREYEYRGTEFIAPNWFSLDAFAEAVVEAVAKKKA